MFRTHSSTNSPQTLAIVESLAGKLGQQVLAAERRARRRGALQPIPVTFEWLEDAGIRFLVRQVKIRTRKPAPPVAGEAKKRQNPFLPYDPALYVADAGPQHICLLNKFPVVPRHTLIVTRHFEHQQTPLGSRDFASWWHCLTSYPSLGFYNGGIIAGASQPHKHMQVVPLPLEKGGFSIPLEPWVWQPLAATAPSVPLVNAVSRYRFTHVAVRLDWPASTPPDQAGQQLECLYRQMLALAEIELPRHPEGQLDRPYNLLLTPRWMMIVPRRHESFATISLNGLAFAGALLVWNPDQWYALQRHGLLAALEYVAIPHEEPRKIPTIGV